MIETRVNDRWALTLPEHRHEFHVQRPDWEAARLDSMHERLRPGAVIADVGAEEGDLPALYASWTAGLPGGGLVLVEPQSAYWPAIRSTFEMNGLGPPRRAFVGFAADENALGDGPSGSIFAHEWPGAAQGPITPDAGFCHLAADAETPRIRLDALTVGLSLDALTIDVEGSELAVLRGASRILADDRPDVWVSVHTDEAWMARYYPDDGLEALLAFMAGYGYDGTLLASVHEDHWVFVPR